MRRFIQQIGWSFASRLVSAALQLVVIVLLARGLEPSRFAAAASATAVMMALVALNGFGLVRQMSYARSLDPDDPDLPAIFALWQRFSFGSAVLWLGGTLAIWRATGDELFLALTPITVWLVFEQLTSVWNSISVVDDRAHDLMPSYLWRRAPVVVALAVALPLDLDVVWTWTVSTAAGSVLAYVFGLHRAAPWSRSVLPGRRPPGTVRFDMGVWLTDLGAQLRDLDVAAITLVSAGIGGVYALPARLVRPMNLVTIAAVTVAYPRIARRTVITPRELFIGSVAGTVPVALVAGVTALGAGLLPTLVGDEYDGAVPVLRVLCLLAVVHGLGGVLAYFLQARSRSASAFTGRLFLVGSVIQLGGAAWAASAGDAVDVAWTVLGITAFFVVWLYARAHLECRREVASGGRAAPPEPAPPSSDAAPSPRS
jgi:O-antigen/teichoic acid export membrane protein